MLSSVSPPAGVFLFIVGRPPSAPLWGAWGGAAGGPGQGTLPAVARPSDVRQTSVRRTSDGRPSDVRQTSFSVIRSCKTPT